jgi:hypothetical protein
MVVVAPAKIDGDNGAGIGGSGGRSGQADSGGGDGGGGDKGGVQGLHGLSPRLSKIQVAVPSAMRPFNHPAPEPKLNGAVHFQFIISLTARRCASPFLVLLGRRNVAGVRSDAWHLFVAHGQFAKANTSARARKHARRPVGRLANPQKDLRVCLVS